MSRPSEELETLIGYNFKDKELLKRALTHSSYVNESRLEGVKDNERLEFFGDAIIEFHVSEYLFENNRDFPEGRLTKMRASMVCENGLAICAKALDLGNFILMGKGEELSGGRERPSITSDAFEALTAAIYIDSEGAAVKEFVKKHIIETLSGKELFFDAKTRLQEITQRDVSNVLRYEIISEEGPVHERVFTAAVFLNGDVIGKGTGHSKKDAHQNAARAALDKLEG